jgi:PKHD-type hydroxylase
MNKRNIFPQEDRDMINWYWFSKGLSDEEIDAVHQKAATLNSQKAVTYGSEKPDESYRKSTITWLDQTDPDNDWLFEKLMYMAVEANKNVWNFDLSYLNESIQYTEYFGGGGHYDYHLDVGKEALSRRKVSIIVQLSNPEEYEGGQFELLRGKNPDVLPNNKGAVILFPCYLLHRVTPVISGTRRSLVLWVGGNHYR